ncbi:hypothetical protein Tco_0131364 [Tanacetum coccineum]
MNITVVTSNKPYGLSDGSNSLFDGKKACNKINHNKMQYIFIDDTMVLQGITINTNAWLGTGHSVNHIYDILYMMGRDNVAVGVEGEGGILEDGTTQPNVGGYIPIID